MRYDIIQRETGMKFVIRIKEHENSLNSRHQILIWKTLLLSKTTDFQDECLANIWIKNLVEKKWWRLTNQIIV